MPWAPTRSCRWPGCQRRQYETYCRVHANLSPRNHGGIPRQMRGLNAAFERAKRLVIERDVRFTSLPASPTNTPSATLDEIDNYFGGGGPHCRFRRRSTTLPRPDVRAVDVRLAHQARQPGRTGGTWAL